MKREKPPRGMAGAPGHSGPRPDADLLAEALDRPDGWLDEMRAAATAVARRVRRRAELDQEQSPLDRGLLTGIATAITSHESLMKRRGTGKPLASVTPLRPSALAAGADKP